MLRPSRSSAATCQLPFSSFSPAERVAPSGTPENSTKRDSEPSVSVREARTVSGTSVSSRPMVSIVARLVASATPTTCTLTSTVEEAVSLLEASVLVAVMLRAMSPEKFSGGVSSSVARSSGATVHVPSPLSVPADNVAPSGTPEICTLSDSDPSRSRSAALKSS